MALGTVVKCGPFLLSPFGSGLYFATVFGPKLPPGIVF